MGLDPQVVETLITAIRQRYPEWSGFADVAFERDERGYKLKTIELAVGENGLLLESALREDLDGRALKSFLERFIRVGKDINLMFLHIPSSSDLSTLYDPANGDGTGQEDLCGALLDLVWGEGESPARLQRFVDFCAAGDLHCPWPLPTYFLFITHPDDDMFVKPRLYRNIAKKLGTPWTAKGGPNGLDYAALKDWSHEMRRALEPHGARDMVDVQSMLWVAGNEMMGGTSPTGSTGDVLSPGGTSALGAPFDRIFDDRAEADWAFDLLAHGCELLGVTGPDDPRIAATLPYGGGHLHLNLGNWLMVGFEPPANENDLGLALLADAPGVKDLAGGRFKEAGGGDSLFALKYLPRGQYRASAELQNSFQQSMPALGSHFSHAVSSGARKYHTPEVAQAIFDADTRERLLTLGLAEYRKQAGVVAEDPAFAPAARELLTAMAADPTKSFYAAHKDGLTEHVQEPVQQLLTEAAERIAPTLREALETKKKLFGVFPKNDWGKGGAWPFYWGAFYPLGGKRTEGCQLYVSLDEEGFTYGFSIGDYASEDRKRFAQNAEEYRGAIVAALGETVNTPDFDFSKENESAAGHITRGIEGLNLAGWLEQGNKVGPHVHALLPWDELLSMERERVITDVVNAFNRLFPLVLLGTMDEPMPAIRVYMEGDIEGPDVNEPYTLDDLVAETSLPKKNLEAWLRAIDRKGQAILYGPPGTGKTYVAERLAKHLVAGGTGTAELVQFHPAYAYEDFMQGMRPKARDGGGLDYPIMDGRFKQFCDEARGRTGLSVLIIDEVNRANLARVFGELMYLLEYRDKSIPLAAGGRFSIPANVRLIGTMNTADRSIALVDHALRRRFAFLPLYPDYQMLADYHATMGGGYDPAKLVEVLKDLNRKIGDHHYEVGTSFFMRKDIAEQLPDVWSMEIEPYLEEYFFDQRATVDSFRWDEVKKKLGAE
jgi:5-methylcytosine-specific restriction protein B